MKLKLGQKRPSCAWAPNWGLDEDVAGTGRRGRPELYFLPGLVTKFAELAALTPRDGAGTWLLAHYQGLIKDSAYSRFISVDMQRQQLVINMPQLYATVGGWGLSAITSLETAEEEEEG
jgi:hypothetical protein